MKATTEEVTTIRMRLKPDEVSQLNLIQRFLGMPSLSRTAARLALWNASMLAAVLGDGDAYKRSTDETMRMIRDAIRHTPKSGLWR